MKKLIPKEDRVKELLKFGIPEKFIKGIGNIEELEFMVEDINGAYFYLPTISDYSFLKNLNIIPIYDRGQTFYVFAYNEEIKKIIQFGLESQKIRKDYGENWNLLLLGIMIDLFDQYIEDDIGKEKFVEVGNKIGFEKSAELFDLRNLPVEEFNKKLEDNEKWELEIAEKLKIL
ncbi:hypothetical protein [Zobellia alginiliquefaciens]|uniref:hypothetical protein n=1 Tax=Zobellia alginiliquefaciens TaxID=3032586 RepID=UPI0023E284A5|nr:hypothetical protein [Zobellia alginiliquefaciens]